MADKQLNFNRPLLSVRRFSSPVSSEKDLQSKTESSHTSIPPIPSYKPESQSGSLRNPGSVPFVWEHSPGKPKDEPKSRKNPPPVVPKLPPGRILKHKKQDLVKMTEDSKVKKGPRKNSLGSQNEEKLTKFESSRDYDEMVKKKPLEVKKKAVNSENEKPRLTYGPNFLQFTGDDSEEDSDFDYDDHENMSYKVCGLLPHFCLKGSIGLLNPIPGLSVRTRLPISSVNKTSSQRQPLNHSEVNLVWRKKSLPLEGSKIKNLLIDLASWAVCLPLNGSIKRQPLNRSEPARVAVYEHKSALDHQDDQTVLKNEPSEATNQKKIQKLQESGLYDRGISETKDVNFQKKGLVSFKELLLADENEKEANSHNNIVEKTLYIDTIHKVETAKFNSYSSSPKGKETDVAVFEVSDFLSDEPKWDKETKPQTGFCKDPKVDQDLEVSRNSGLELPAIPPLPKSPSDSWLWRTLPSKTASLRTNPKYPSPKIAARLDKNVQLRHPQGLLFPIPET